MVAGPPPLFPCPQPPCPRLPHAWALHGLALCHSARHVVQTEGGTATLSSMSGAGGSGRNDPLRTISAIKEDDLGGKEKADYVKVELPRALWVL